MTKDHKHKRPQIRKVTTQARLQTSTTLVSPSQTTPRQNCGQTFAKALEMWLVSRGKSP